MLDSGDVVDIIGGPVAADGYTWRNVRVTGTNVTGWVANMFLD